VRIGILDNATSDKANFSPGEQTFTSCNGETPNLDVLEGNFVVEDDVVEEIEKLKGPPGRE
jgi:hypothetical protein